MSQQQAIHKFALGQKEVEGKQAEFWYDRGWYSIVELEGEDRSTIYRSKNAQEAYMKWNVYIGRKKERPVSDDRRRERSENGEGGRRSRQDKDNRRDREKEQREGKPRRRQKDSRRENRRPREREEQGNA